MSVTILLNEESGPKSGATRDAIRREIVRLGAAASVETVRGSELVAAVDAAAGAAETIVAAGGDGTVSAAAARLAGTDKLLGILPLGTFNNFARDLGLPLDWQSALRVALRGKPRTVDVGVVNDHVFVNNSSIGMYAETVHERERIAEQLEQRSWLPQIGALVAAIRRFHRLSITITTDSGQVRCESPFVFVGNNDYAVSPPGLGRRESLDDGCLCVHVCRHRGPASMFGLLARALVGRVHQDTDFETFRSADLTIHSRLRQLKVAVDGEVVLLAPPLRYRIEPAALRVVVQDEDVA